jgi:hypothetical protein
MPNATAEPSERACGCTKRVIGHKGAEALKADGLADLHTSEKIATIALKDDNCIRAGKDHIYELSFVARVQIAADRNDVGCTWPCRRSQKLGSAG